MRENMDNTYSPGHGAPGEQEEVAFSRGRTDKQMNTRNSPKSSTRRKPSTYFVGTYILLSRNLNLAVIRYATGSEANGQRTKLTPDRGKQRVPRAQTGLCCPRVRAHVVTNSCAITARGLLCVWYVVCLIQGLAFVQMHAKKESFVLI